MTGNSNSSAVQKRNVYLQFGCGLSAPKNWLNYDSSPSLLLQRLPLFGVMNFFLPVVYPKNVFYGDVIKGLPVENNSVDLVYSSHVLEHMSYLEMKRALREIYRILKPGGIFRLVVPDLTFFITNYCNEVLNPEASHLAAENFLKGTILGEYSPPKNFFLLLRKILGNSQHKWMYDFESLSHALSMERFTSIRRASYNDSIEMAFQDVELRERWTNCLGIECRK